MSLSLGLLGGAGASAVEGCVAAVAEFQVGGGFYLGAAVVLKSILAWQILCNYKTAVAVAMGIGASGPDYARPERDFPTNEVLPQGVAILQIIAWCWRLKAGEVACRPFGLAGLVGCAAGYAA